MKNNMNVDDSLVPIFIEMDIPKQVKQIGTGVFIDFQSEPFLFTAAHVTDENRNGRLLVPTIHGLSEIEGYLAHIDLPPELTRNDDSIDMAYYRLSTSFARELCGNFTPLIKKCELIESALNLESLSVVGYPASKAKKRGGIFSSELAFYRGCAAEERIYENNGIGYQNNILIKFNKKNVVSPYDGKKFIPPSPRGVSGGAIFAWPKGSELSLDWSLPVLVGILHSYKEKEGIFIGTTLVPYVAAVTLGRMKGYGGVI